MTVSITDGILGLEGIHTWTYGTDASITINDLAVMPRVRLTKITGIHGHAESEDNREPLTGRSGEQIFPSFVRGRTVAYEGVIEARSLQMLRQRANLLRGRFHRRYGEGTMVVAPHANYGSVSHWFKARVIDYQSDEEQIQSPHSAYPYSRGFTLSMRQRDARSYVSGQQSAAANSGVQIFCLNQGLVATDPIVEIDGPISGTVVLTRGDGKKLTFQSITIATGSKLTVDFFQNLASDLAAGNDMTGHLQLTLSDWWDEKQEGLRAGINEGFTVTGGHYTVYWYHANP